MIRPGDKTMYPGGSDVPRSEGGREFSFISETCVSGSRAVNRQGRMIVSRLQASGPEVSIVRWLPRPQERETKPS